MKVLFGMALRQTTGFVESLLRLVGLDWTVPDFSTLSRRQKTLAVNIPYRGSKGQQGDQGRGRRRMACPQTWRSEKTGLAQDLSRN